MIWPLLQGSFTWEGSAPPYPLSISLLTEEVSFHVPSTEEYPLPLGPCSSQVTPPLTITTSLRELTVPML